jgi:hypothetical protein
MPGQEGGYDDFDEEDLLLATGKSGPKPFPTTLAFDSTGKPLSKQPPKLPRSLLRETKVELPEETIVDKEIDN